MTGFCRGVGGKELGGWGTKQNTDSLLYVYLYIISNFELYITYSEREMKGEGRKKKGEKQNKKKKEPTKLNVTLFFPECTFCSDNKMVVSPRKGGIKMVSQTHYDPSCLNPFIFPSPVYFLFHVLPDGLGINNSRKSSLTGPILG